MKEKDIRSCDMAKHALQLGGRIFMVWFSGNLGCNQSRNMAGGNEMWYAVWVRTGQEERVLQMCRTMLLEQCFLPKYELKRKKDGQWVKMEKPLFPGYLFFVSENVEILVSGLNPVPDFTKVLGDGLRPIALYPHEVEFLQKYMNGNKVLEMSCGFLEGDRLVVTDGPLKDYQGKIVRIDRHKRLAVLEMEFFGRITRMTVGLEVVRKI